MKKVKTFMAANCPQEGNPKSLEDCNNCKHQKAFSLYYIECNWGDETLNDTTY